MSMWSGSQTDKNRRVADEKEAKPVAGALRDWTLPMRLVLKDGDDNGRSLGIHFYGKNMKPPNPSQLSYPNRKISETVLEFARPLLAQMPPGADSAEIEQALAPIVTLWNAVVFDTVEGRESRVGQIIDRLSNHPVLLAVAVEYISRKQRFFGDDFRLIGAIKVTRRPGDIYLWAEARDPYGRRSDGG